jgi:small subunit ribosomal protein S6
MMERYRRMIEAAGGVIHREEDWGRRQLAHSISKVHKAHYLLLNIECGQDTLNELTGAFRFNDAVLRHLVIKRTEAITEASHMAKAQEEEKARDAQAAADAARSRGPGRTKTAEPRADDDGELRGEDSGDDGAVGFDDEAGADVASDSEEK